MTRALDSVIGLPSRSTRAVRMLSLLMPPDVSRNFMIPLLSSPHHYTITALEGQRSERSGIPVSTGLRRCRLAKNNTHLHALTQSFRNRGHVLDRMPRSPGKDVAGVRVTNDRGHHCF